MRLRESRLKNKSLPLLEMGTVLIQKILFGNSLLLNSYRCVNCNFIYTVMDLFLFKNNI